MILAHEILYMSCSALGTTSVVGKPEQKDQTIHLT